MKHKTLKSELETIRLAIINEINSKFKNEKNEFSLNRGLVFQEVDDQGHEVIDTVRFEIVLTTYMGKLQQKIPFRNLSNEFLLEILGAIEKGEGEWEEVGVEQV